ncbi:MAG: YbaB/EbfC family nucleoid-associated protein [Lachnospiraceae bacterium]|nr:YbaB/EbfC family nucleoid-associated protein [Lachnospiraceae bacterium]
MAKRSGGYGGGMPGNMNNLMKQAQKMQRQMEEQQKAMEEKEFISTVGGGAVKISMNGKREILSLTLDPDAVDPEDVETLQDLLIAAFRDVLKQVEEEQASQMSSLAGGLGSLGGLGGLGGGLF